MTALEFYIVFFLVLFLFLYGLDHFEFVEEHGLAFIVLFWVIMIFYVALRSCCCEQQLQCKQQLQQEQVQDQDTIILYDSTGQAYIVDEKGVIK